MSERSTDLSAQVNLYTVTRIKLHSFDSGLLNTACSNLVTSIQSLGGKVTGPIRLPTSKHYYCVLNSPHVDKKSREHFEVSEYKRLLDVYTPKNMADVFDSFFTIPIPAGVLVEIAS